MNRRKTSKPRPLKVPVQEVMSEYVESVRPGATIQEAAVRMRAFDVGFLLVQSQDELVGVLTDRDVTVRVTAAGKNARKTSVSEVMTRDIIFCWAGQGVDEAARIMRMNQVRRLVVLSEDGRLRGVVTLGDLARHGFEEEAGGVLAATLQPLPVFSPLTVHDY